ncbi:glycosyltransferase [Clostridium sp. FP2]|uniref:glycosyltransferase family protein n=1 Tax=Clostridium sp. FP2 TaxID=2724481 RepID=UPI0013E94DE2|nr:glycosyltransferase [Clostridium sp. FP2]MBZ9622593.1 glycosyltransferase [Clostridium sp. FP2]
MFDVFKNKFPIALYGNTNNKKPFIKVACILDTFSYECLKYECNLIQLQPYTCQSTIVQEKPDLLLVESAWKGIDEKWKSKVGYLNTSRDTTLERLVGLCKTLKIPTVFWNKEDPYHFDLFLPAARLFEYIFTTDVNSINRYKKLVGHDNVYVLPFAAQLKIHNPIDKDKGKLGQVAFAGTWYNSGHLDRRKNMENVLNPALKYNLHIYDRNYHTANISYRFPDMYQRFNKGCISYEQMNEIYKRYNVFLNINSINDSPTMFSRRVFELLACGTNVISSYSLGIEDMFFQIVKLSKSKEDTQKHLEVLLKDKELSDRLSLKGQREVFSKHTYTHRFESILDKVGIIYEKQGNSSVSIITCTNSPSSIENIFSNYERQKYENKELIIILNNNTLSLEIWQEKAKCYNNVKVFKLYEEKSLGECLNYGVSKASFDYVSRFDHDNYYAPEFIGDLMNAFKYSDADIIGKNTYYEYLGNSKIMVIKYPNLENCYVTSLCASAMIIKKMVFDKVRFIGGSSECNTEFFKRCMENSIKLYSADRFNFACISCSYIDEDISKLKDEKFLRNCRIIGCVDDYKELITV